MIIDIAIIVFIFATFMLQSWTYAQDRRAWQQERRELLNRLATQGQLIVPTEEPSQKLPETVTVPDAEEYEKVGVILDFPENGKDKE